MSAPHPQVGERSIASWSTPTLTPIKLEHSNPNPYQAGAPLPQSKSSWGTSTLIPTKARHDHHHPQSTSNWGTPTLISTELGYPPPQLPLRQGILTTIPIPFQEYCQEMQRQAPGGGSPAVAGAERGSAGAG